VGGGKCFADSLEAEEVARHGALRGGRQVRLSDSHCDAGSQWTPELVHVAAAVLDAMLAHSRRAAAATPAK